MDWNTVYSLHRKRVAPTTVTDVILAGSILCLFAGVVACTIQGWLT